MAMTAEELHDQENDMKEIECVATRDTNTYTRKMDREHEREAEIEHLTDELFEMEFKAIHERLWAARFRGGRSMTAAKRAIKMMEDALDEAAAVLVDEPMEE